MHVLFWVVKHNCREHFQHAVAEMICKMQANEFSCEMHLQNKLRNSIAEKRGNYVLLKIWKLEDKFQIVVSRLGDRDTRTARSPGRPVDQATEPPEPFGRQSRSVAWSTGGPGGRAARAARSPEPLGRLVHRWQSHCLAHFIYAFAYRGSTTYKKVWPNRFTSATANWNLFVKIISAIAFYEQYLQSQFLKVSCNWNLNFIFEIAICKAYVRFQFAIVFHNPVLKIFIVIWFPITLSNSFFKWTFNYSQYVRQFKSFWIAQNEFRPE